MIDASLAKKVAVRTLREARKFYGIDPAWNIDLRVDGIQSDASANVELLLEYRRACITIDPTKCDSVQEVREFVAHEVAHVLLSDYRVFRGAVQARFTPEEMPDDVDLAFVMADERTTRLLEQLFLRERPA